jgi:thiol-disulfide isomerase/thioredoxin
MKKLLYLVFAFSIMSFAIPWQPSFEKAKAEAKATHKYILLNFSGSDWCGPCIRMRNEIFSSDAFLKMADSSLVLVNADFPRSKKNKPARDIQKQNESLADKYNKDGKFPYTLLLDENGKVVKSWEGLPEEKAVAYAAEIRKLITAKK